ncbi:hypothetical protein QVE09_16350 [Paenibacillus sp. ClWae2A]|uniref:hypothetical protein n=1 Tax=Paenibacillus sp. ClWae2A TaxID=3057177 RepID=UPI0028F550AD|nr:hypothetical protein [Paenibacillus sp. ClWae2A]MDT9720491.1 hypothetical protein [Paenibacillus sp. ClWae2A]
MEIGRKVYYEKASGNVIWVTDQRMGMVVETTVEQDFAFYSALAGRVPETVGLLQLEFDAYEADYGAGGQITRIDLETMEPLFTYPDPTDPETPQEPRPALSKQVDQLAAESNANQLALMELHMMLLGEMPDAE